MRRRQDNMLGNAAFPNRHGGHGMSALISKMVCERTEAGEKVIIVDPKTRNDSENLIKKETTEK